MKNDTPTLIIVGVLLATIFLLLLVIGSNGQQSSGDLTTQNAFVNGCASEPSATVSYCQCTYDHLRQTMTDADIIRAGADMTETGELPDNFNDAVYACIDRL